eukprot:5127900-Pyramimonas_sp.AAC.1
MHPCSAAVNSRSAPAQPARKLFRFGRMQRAALQNGADLRSPLRDLGRANLQMHGPTGEVDFDLHSQNGSFR